MVPTGKHRQVLINHTFSTSTRIRISRQYTFYLISHNVYEKTTYKKKVQTSNAKL